MYEVLQPLYGNPSLTRDPQTTMVPPSRVKGLILSDLKNPSGKGLTEENILKISMCQFTWMTDFLVRIKGHYGRVQEGDTPSLSM